MCVQVSTEPPVKYTMTTALECIRGFLDQQYILLIVPLPPLEIRDILTV